MFEVARACQFGYLSSNLSFPSCGLTNGELVNMLQGIRQFNNDAGAVSRQAQLLVFCSVLAILAAWDASV